MVRIIVASKYKLMLEGIKGILAKCSDYIVVAEAVDDLDLIQCAAKAVADLLLLEPTIANGDTAKLIGDLQEVAPPLAILVCETRPTDYRAIDLIRAGARGVVSKRTASTDFLTAIRKVACGHVYVDEELAEQIAIDLVLKVRDQDVDCRLSKRENEVLLMLANGLSVTKISQKMHLSVKTISTHKSRLLVKLGLRGTAELVLYAIRHHLINTSFEVIG